MKFSVHYVSYLLFALIGAAAGYLIDGFRGGFLGGAVLLLGAIFMSFAAKAGKWLVIAMAIIFLVVLFYLKYSVQSN